MTHHDRHTDADATQGGAKFTPGPWRYEPSTNNFGGYAIYGSDRRGGQVLPILGMTYNWPQNALANARLIAAAPDLFAALQGVLRVADRKTVEFDQARAALALATRREPNDAGR